MVGKLKLCLLGDDKHALGYSDNHKSGGLVVKARGKYFVAFAHHNVGRNTYWVNCGGS